MNKYFILITLLLGLTLILGCNINPVSSGLTSKSLVLNSFIMVDEDLRFPVQSIKTRGASNTPTLETFRNNTYAFAFSDTTINNGYVTAQIPHSKINNTHILPHFHWSQVGVSVGDVVWCYEYTWTNINDVFPFTSLKCVTDTANGTPYIHHMTDMIIINGTGKTDSSIINSRIYRDTDNINDTLNEDAYLLEFDIHYYKYLINK